MKKVILIVISVIAGVSVLWGIFLVVGSFIIGGFFNPPIGEEKMGKLFEKDREQLVTVTSYFKNSGYESIYIPDTMESGKMFVGGKDDIKIEDVEVIGVINDLKKKGYNVIGKDENTIYFQRWSNLDNGRGVAYSINSEEPKLPFLTKLEALTDANWYYYEEDFNEWRLKQ